MSKVLVISDLHIPYHDDRALDFLAKVYKMYDCDTVVCVGDEVDFHGISFHKSNPDLNSAGHELREAVHHLKKLYKMFPKVKVCTSNHTALPFRRAFDIGLPKQLIRSYQEILEAPLGWEWEDEWIIDGVSYIHGENLGSSLSALKNAVTKRRIPTVMGHLHSEAGVYYSSTKHDLCFAMNVGCLIDIDSLAFEYGKKFALRPVLGCGVVLDGVPFFIPMNLEDKKKPKRIVPNLETIEKKKRGPYKKKNSHLNTLLDAFEGNSTKKTAELNPEKKRGRGRPKGK